MAFIIRSRDSKYEALKNETSTDKPGGIGRECFMLKDFWRFSVSGFTANEHAHMRQCMDCRMAFNSFMRIKRDEARMRDRLDPYEDVFKKAFGIK